MDACAAVGREADKVVSKFTNLNKSTNKSIDEQISQIGNNMLLSFNAFTLFSF